MSNENEEVSAEEPQPEPDQNKALKIPGAALADFLNRVAPDNKCAFCHVGEYNIISAPTGGGVAGVVAATVPNVQHLGIWFFLGTCERCGYTALFNCQSVLAAMNKDE
jgi:predicted nucleic-acid-binding Zn-ribbon protein